MGGCDGTLTFTDKTDSCEFMTMKYELQAKLFGLALQNANLS